MNRYLAELLINDDANEDLVEFTFPNETRKIKCSRSMLSNISEVFKTMLNEKWCTDIKRPSIELNDVVGFDQYVIFKMFVEIIYGIRHVSSMNFDQGIDIYFYAHKYDVKDVSDKIVKHLLGLQIPFSTTKLKNYIEFVRIYELIDFEKHLDNMNLALNLENHMEVYAIVKSSGLNKLKKQVVDYLKTIEPKSDWCPEAFQGVIKSLKEDVNYWKMKEVQPKPEGVQKNPKAQQRRPEAQQRRLEAQQRRPVAQAKQRSRTTIDRENLFYWLFME